MKLLTMGVVIPPRLCVDDYNIKIERGWWCIRLGFVWGIVHEDKLQGAHDASELIKAYPECDVETEFLIWHITG